MKKFINQLVPFILVGIAVVAFAFGIMLLAYLFLIGACVGLLLFTIAWIRQKFFPKKTMVVTKHKKRSGRIIDSNDWKEL